MNKRGFLFLLFFSFLFSCSFQNEKNLAISSNNENISIAAYFSPRGGATFAIIKEIETAKTSIDLAVFSFTSKKLARALIKAHDSGIKVRVIIDRETAKSRRCIAPLLRDAGIPVRFKRGSRGGLMHNKFAVIDSNMLITGSFNWTVSAEKRNDENIVIIKGDKPLVKKFTERFKYLWRLARLEE